MTVDRDTGMIRINTVEEASSLEATLHGVVHRGDSFYPTQHFAEWCVELNVEPSVDAVNAYARRLGLALTQFWRKRAESGTTVTDAV